MTCLEQYDQLSTLYRKLDGSAALLFMLCDCMERDGYSAIISEYPKRGNYTMECGVNPLTLWRIEKAKETLSGAFHGLSQKRITTAVAPIMRTCTCPTQPTPRCS